MQKDAIQCVIGLGNPGANYAATRHNVGFWLVDRLAQSYGAVFRSENKFFGEVANIHTAQGDCWLLKPMTYMNNSGRAVSALAHFYKIPADRLLVVHDELDLPPGTIRLKQEGGHGGHNGLRDTISAMQSKAFLRLRIGIGHPGHRDAVTNYVLKPPTKAEQIAIEAGLDEAERYWPVMQSGDLQEAMRGLHTATG